MGFHIRWAVAAAFLSMVMLSPAAAQSVEDVEQRIEMLHGGVQTFEVAFEVLQERIAAGDAETVAAMVSYPLFVSIDGERVAINGEVEFAERYDDLITPEIAEIITGQDYADLFVNQDGVMFGDGEVWMQPFCTDGTCEVVYWLIEAINLP
jgi:hypothetical protein